jgi:voltage-gated sodium channel
MRNLEKDAEKKCNLFEGAEERGIEAEIRNLKETLEKEDNRGVDEKLQVQMGFSVKAGSVLVGRKAGRARLFVHDLLSRQRFDACIGLVIVANSITIGVEQTYRMAGDKEVLDQCKVLEMVYLFVYTVELSMRFFAHGRACLKSAWVQFDAVLVGLGILTTFVIEPMLEETKGTAGGNDAAKLLGPVMVLRVLRLARLARAVRLLAQFKELWMLVRGLMSSAGTMFYTFVLILIILYVFACLGIELITTDMETREDPEYNRLVETYFPDIFVSMLTLVQFVLVDSMAAIYTPMIALNPTLIPFFVLFILVVPISLMNLVTAVIVEGSLEQAKQDREVAKAYKNHLIVKMMPRIEKMFEQLDADGSGDISLDEIEAAPEELADELAKCFQTDDLYELFEMLDNDRTGTVPIHQFCSELVKVVVSDRSVDQVRMQKTMVSLRAGVLDVRGIASVDERM